MAAPPFAAAFGARSARPSAAASRPAFGARSARPSAATPFGSGAVPSAPVSALLSSLFLSLPGENEQPPLRDLLSPSDLRALYLEATRGQETSAQLAEYGWSEGIPGMEAEAGPEEAHAGSAARQNPDPDPRCAFISALGMFCTVVFFLVLLKIGGR
jgi:hypothetical protein